ncbi:hypothetical protein [Crenothrix polyspora]|uniref:Lipoprotein n=1 Tax=Crenothrix polyspora TaxID=360316 RepID=A0A1R4HHD4_9GAMM|nr:hypothetical protein [Crenothrix polyspora]SJM95290.1 exported hypothetical protein [Crenothrix polyspora]
MNIYNVKCLCLIALFFTAGCQNPSRIVSKPAVLKPTVSNEILNEIVQANHPQSKIHVANGMVRQVPMGYYREPDVGTLRLGKDNCFYIELDNGIKVLPVLISEYSSPENLSFSYTKALGKKVMGYYRKDAIDLTSTAFNESNIGWVTLPPHLQCDISRVHQYRSLELYRRKGEHEGHLTDDSEYNSQLSNPKSEGKLSYIGVYNYAHVYEDDDFYIATHGLVSEGVFFTEKDCLYIRFKDGKIALPIFRTQRTFWQDTKNTLRASGRDFHLGETYFFAMMPSTGELFSGPQIITPPHSSCNAKQVRYVHNIYEPAEFKKKEAEYKTEEYGAKITAERKEMYEARRKALVKEEYEARKKAEVNRNR